MGANGLSGARAGQTAGHYVKLISLAPDLEHFKLYATSIARAIATCGTARAPRFRPAAQVRTGSRSTSRTTSCRGPRPTSRRRRRGVIDEDTYVQQGRDLERAYSLQVINYILGTLQPDTDLAMVGYPFTDEVSHQFMGLVSPTDIDGNPNPCYDVTRSSTTSPARAGAPLIASRPARATSAAPTRMPTRSSGSRVT